MVYNWNGKKIKKNEELNLKISSYTIDLERASEFINKNNSQFVALQVPEGLKADLSKILDYFEKNTKSSFIIYEEDRKSVV